MAILPRLEYLFKIPDIVTQVRQIERAAQRYMIKSPHDLSSVRSPRNSFRTGDTPTAQYSQFLLRCPRLHHLGIARFSSHMIPQVILNRDHCRHDIPSNSQYYDNSFDALIQATDQVLGALAL